MSSDRTAAIPATGKPGWDLPAITAVKVSQKPFQPKEMRNFASPLPAVPDAVEIVVTLAEPLPVRAMPPVLYVGDTPLTESEGVDQEGREIRFWLLEPDTIKAGAPLALAWMGDRPEPNKSKFRYQKPE